MFGKYFYWEGRALCCFLKPEIEGFLQVENDPEIEGFLQVENDPEIEGFFYCSQVEELNLRLKLFSLFRWRIIRQVEESSNLKV